MDTLPDLQGLSVAEKDALIGGVWARVAELTATVKELQGRLGKHRRNSRKPPSSDGLNKPQPKSLRTRGEKPAGGRQGHTGHTLKRVAAPDRIQTPAPASHCAVWHRPIGAAAAVETRPVFDLPPLRREVAEHRVRQAPCACGKVHRGTFPAVVSAPVQYGPHSTAAVVQLLTHHHLLPLARTDAPMHRCTELFDRPMSDATVLAIPADAQERLAPTVAAMGEALKAAPLAPAAATGMRVASTVHWMHVPATPLPTWLGAHPKRGTPAFDAFGLPIAFAGTPIHDGWRPGDVSDMVIRLQPQTRIC